MTSRQIILARASALRYAGKVTLNLSELGDYILIVLKQCDHSNQRDASRRRQIDDAGVVDF